MVKQEKLKYWKEQIKKYEKGELSLTDWCEKNKTTKGSYHYWKKLIQLEEVRTTSKKSEEVKFIKVEPTSIEPISIEPISTKPIKQAILNVTWNDLQIKISTKEDTYLAAELIKNLQLLC